MITFCLQKQECTGKKMQESYMQNLIEVLLNIIILKRLKKCSIITRDPVVLLLVFIH